MALIKIGEHGAHVSQVQKNLNARPSKLPPLKTDGVFGLRTQARVIEFQRDNGLKADGIVGDLTNAKLRGGVTPPAIDLLALVNQMSLQLNPVQRASFINTAQPLVADRTLLANTIVIEAIVVMLVLLFFATLLVNSQNKANQEAGRELNRKVNNLRERLRTDPSQAPTVSAEALKEAKDQGRKLAQRAIDEREKCFGKFTPDQFAQKSRACAKFIAAVTTAIQSLLQKIDTPVGGGITVENLIKGIGASAAALMTALRELGGCMGCDNLFF